MTRRGLLVVMVGMVTGAAAKELQDRKLKRACDQLMRNIDRLAARLKREGWKGPDETGHCAIIDIRKDLGPDVADALLRDLRGIPRRIQLGGLG